MDVKIVLATNENYAGAVAVTIRSAITHKNEDDTFHFTILHTGISDVLQKKYCRMSEKNVIVDCMDISLLADEVQGLGCRHLTAETMYRLYIPELFPNDDKVLYLDGDMVVLGDLAEVYETDVSGYILAAVMDPPSYGSIDHYASFMKSDPEENFNAGILLINSQEFTRNNVKEKCINLLLEDAKEENPKLDYMDNDALNIVCQGKVKILSLEWNFPPLIHYWKMDNAIANLEHRKQYLDALESKKIIHFTGMLKPWIYTGMLFAEEFWEYEAQVDFREELVAVRKVAMERLSKRPPYWHVKFGSNIVIYGMGSQGRRFEKRIREAGFANIVMMIDQKTNNKGGDVKPVECIENVVFDKVIVAITDEAQAVEGYNSLRKNGVPKEKIEWIFERNKPWSE